MFMPGCRGTRIPPPDGCRRLLTLAPVAPVQRRFAALPWPEGTILLTGGGRCRCTPDRSAPCRPRRPGGIACRCLNPGMRTPRPQDRNTACSRLRRSSSTVCLSRRKPCPGHNIPAPSRGPDIGCPARNPGDRRTSRGAPMADSRALRSPALRNNTRRYSRGSLASTDYKTQGKGPPRCLCPTDSVCWDLRRSDFPEFPCRAQCRSLLPPGANTRRPGRTRRPGPSRHTSRRQGSDPRSMVHIARNISLEILEYRPREHTFVPKGSPDTTGRSQILNRQHTGRLFRLSGGKIAVHASMA